MRFLITLISLSALALIGCNEPAAAGAAGATEMVATAATPCTVHVSVEGMACGKMCPPKVTKQMETVAGVNKVEMDYSIKTAMVDAQPALCTDKAAAVLLGALKAPFVGKIVKIEPKDKS